MEDTLQPIKMQEYFVSERQNVPQISLMLDHSISHKLLLVRSYRVQAASLKAVMLFPVSSGLLQKIDNLLKYPHSHRANKIPVAKRVTIMDEKLEKHKVINVLAKEREKSRRTKKNTRTLPPLDPFQDDIDPVLMTETGEMSVPATQRGNKPKYAVVVN